LGIGGNRQYHLEINELQPKEAGQNGLAVTDAGYTSQKNFQSLRFAQALIPI